MSRVLALPALLLLALSGCLAFHRGPMPGEPKGATYVELLGTRVRYEDVGEGPPVVLVHGFASSLENWLTVTPALRGSHRVISLDLKGFGWTDRPEGDYSPAAQAALVFALMDHLGVEQAAVVGHSWGASVVLRMALEKPERVTRIALYDAWVYEEQVPAFFIWARGAGVGEALFRAFYDERPAEKMANAFYDASLMSETLVEEVERALRRPGTKAAALAAVRGQTYAEVQKRYRTLKQPTLLLWGENDRVTPVTVGERLHLELPNSQLVRYPRCGHFPMLEAAPQSTAALRRFLAEGAP